jgi:peroxiredoxin
MSAWAKDQGVEGSIITFMGDPYSQLTGALDMILEHPGPRSVGLINRSKRNALYLVDGVTKGFRLSENKMGKEDPAGDDFPEDTCAPAMLDLITSKQEL